MEKVKQSCRADGELIYVQSGWAFFDDYEEFLYAVADIARLQGTGWE